MTTSDRLFHTAAKAAAILSILTVRAVGATPAASSSTNALWVYSVTSLPSPVTDAPTRSTLIQNAAASGVNMLYVSVYSSTPNAAGRYLDDESDIAQFISMAHTQGMEVYAATGDPDWPTLGCATSANPSKRLADIAGYSKANSPAAFDGVMLDVEPGSSPDFVALLGLYQCLQQQAQASGLGLAAAINAFWTTSVTFNGVTEEAYKQIVDLKLNGLVVMGYRNFAGTLDCTQGDGVVCLDENIIAYASSTSRGNTILVGLDTDNPATSGATSGETFYLQGQATMNTQAQSVSTQFAAANETFGGFAINNYRDSYLSGSVAGWPAANSTPPIAPPQFSAASIANAASFLSGNLAPGELISLFGQNLGPRSPQGLQLSGGKVTTTTGGVTVLFNGIPAPMVMAYAGQVNAIVPFEIQGSSTVKIQVEYSGVTSSSVTAQVAPASPGIFTADSSGKGAAAALNQNYSYNGSGNPASAGSVVILYLTGAGQTTPLSVDGFVSASAGTLVQPMLPVSAEIGGLPATVLYTGSSVGIVNGVMQVNLVVPSGLSSGAQPVVIEVGQEKTQTGVTVAVR